MAIPRPAVVTLCLGAALLGLTDRARASGTATPSEVPVGRAVRVNVSVTAADLVDPPIAQVAPGGATGMVTGATRLSPTTAEVWLVAFTPGALTLRLSTTSAGQFHDTPLTASSSAPTSSQLTHLSPTPAADLSTPQGAVLDLGEQPDAQSVQLDVSSSSGPGQFRVTVFGEAPDPTAGSFATRFVLITQDPAFSAGPFSFSLGPAAALVAQGRPFWVHVQVENTAQPDGTSSVLSYVVRRGGALAGGGPPAGAAFFQAPIGKTSAPSLGLDPGGYFDFKVAAQANAPLAVTAWFRLDSDYVAAITAGAQPPQVTVQGAHVVAVHAGVPVGTAADTWVSVSLTVNPTRAELLTVQVRSLAPAGSTAKTYVDDISVAQVGGADVFDASLPPAEPSATVFRTSDPIAVRSPPFAVQLRQGGSQSFRAAVAAAGRTIVGEAYVKVLSGNPLSTITLTDGTNTISLKKLPGSLDERGWERFIATLPAPSVRGTASLQAVVSNANPGEVAIDDLRLGEAPRFFGVVDPVIGPKRVQWFWSEPLSAAATRRFALRQSTGQVIDDQIGGSTRDYVEANAPENTRLNRALDLFDVPLPSDGKPESSFSAFVVTPVQPPGRDDLLALFSPSQQRTRITARTPLNSTVGLTGLEVVRGDDDALTGQSLLQAFTATYQVDDAPAAQPLWYAVRYRSSDGQESPRSPAVEAILVVPVSAPQALDFQVYAEPTGRGALVVARRPDQGTLGAARLEIQRATEATFTTDVVDVPADELAYTVRDRSGPGTYYYRIRYLDPFGDPTTYSPVVPVTVGGDLPPAPGKPVASIAAIAANQVTVTWTWADNSTNEVEFRVLDQDGQVIASVPTATWTETLAPNQTVRRAVTAVSENAIGDASPVTTFTTPFPDGAGTRVFEVITVAPDVYRVTVELPPYGTEDTKILIQRSLSGTFADATVVSDSTDQVIYDPAPAGSTPSYRFAYRDEGGAAGSFSVGQASQGFVPTSLIVWLPPVGGEGSSADQTLTVNQTGQILRVQLVRYDGEPLKVAGVDVAFELRQAANVPTTAEFEDGLPADNTWRVVVKTNAEGIAESPRVVAGSVPGPLVPHAVVEHQGFETTIYGLLQLVGPRVTLTFTPHDVVRGLEGTTLPGALTVTANDGQPVSGLRLVFEIEDSDKATFVGGGRTAVVTTNGAGLAVAPSIVLVACGDTYLTVSAAPGVAAPPQGIVDPALQPLYDVMPMSVRLAVDPPGTQPDTPAVLTRLHDETLRAPVGGEVGPLQYVVLDACGRPVPNVIVRFTNQNTDIGGTPRPVSQTQPAQQPQRVPQRTDELATPVPFKEGASLPRAFHTATRAGPNVVLLAGGSTQDGAAVGTRREDTLASKAVVVDFAFCTSVETTQRPRIGHTATRLPDGRVLIVGGRDAGGSIVPTQVFDPTSGQITDAPVAFSAIPRRDHSALLVGDAVLLVGGLDGAGVAITTAEVIGFDGGSRASFALSGAERLRPGLTVFHKRGHAQDGDVLVVGNAGAQVTEVLAIDVASRSFTTLGPVPDPGAGFTPRDAVTLPRDGSEPDQGQVLVVGLEGALVFDPTDPGAIFRTSDNDLGVGAFITFEHHTLARAPSALPTSALDRIVLSNHEGRVIFYSRDHLGSSARFFATADEIPLCPSGVTAFATNDEGYSAVIGTVLYLGGSTGSSPADTNQVKDSMVPLTAPAVSLLGMGSGGGRNALYVVTNAGGVATIERATLDLEAGRHTIRAEVLPIRGAGVATHTHLVGEDPQECGSPGKGGPPSQGEPLGEPGDPHDPPPPFVNIPVCPCGPILIDIIFPEEALINGADLVLATEHQFPNGTTGWTSQLRRSPFSFVPAKVTADSVRLVSVLSEAEDGSTLPTISASGGGMVSFRTDGTRVRASHYQVSISTEHIPTGTVVVGELIVDMGGSQTVCPFVVSSKEIVDLQITNKPLLIDRPMIQQKIASLGGDLKAYADQALCYTSVTGTYISRQAMVEAFGDAVPPSESSEIFCPVGECCFVMLESTEHFVFDNGKRRKVLRDSCESDPYQICEKLIPIGPVSGSACVRAFLIPPSAADFVEDAPVPGADMPAPEPCATACTCIVSGSVWIANKDSVTDDVVVTSDQSDVIGPDCWTHPCPTRKLAIDPNKLYIGFEGGTDGELMCCLPVTVEIVNSGYGEASFDPCFAKTTQLFMACQGIVYECPIYGLKESCRVGDVIISISQGGSKTALVVPGSLGLKSCPTKPCVPQTRCTVLGIRSEVCKTSSGCDDLVQLKGADGSMKPAEMTVCLIGPEECEYDICIQQRGGGSVVMSENASLAGATAELTLVKVKAKPPAECANEGPPIEQDPTKSQVRPKGASAGDGMTTQPRGAPMPPPPPCPPGADVRTVFLGGVAPSAEAFDVCLDLRLKALDAVPPPAQECPEPGPPPPPSPGGTQTRSSPAADPRGGTQTRPGAPPPDPLCLLSRSEDVSVVTVKLLVCETPGQDDDYVCFGGVLPIKVDISPSLDGLCAGEATGLTLVLAPSGKLKGSGNSIPVTSEIVPASDFGGVSAAVNDYTLTIKRTCGDLPEETWATEDFTVVDGALTLPTCVCAEGEVAPFQFEMEPKTGWPAGQEFTWTLDSAAGHLLFDPAQPTPSFTFTMDPADVFVGACLGDGAPDEVVQGSLVQVSLDVCGAKTACGTPFKSTVVGVEVVSVPPGGCLNHKARAKGTVEFRLLPEKLDDCPFLTSIDTYTNGGGFAGLTPLPAELSITTREAGSSMFVDLEAKGDLGARVLWVRCYREGVPECDVYTSLIVDSGLCNEGARNCFPPDPLALSGGDWPGSPTGDLADSVDPVDLARGELTLSRTDLSIEGRGAPFEHVRTYRSQTDRETVQGYGWDFNFNTRLPALTGALDRSRTLIEGGRALSRIFVQAPEPVAAGGSIRFLTPPSLFVDLREAPTGELRIVDRDGSSKEFDVQGRLRRATDVHGNQFELFYGAELGVAETRDLLTTVRDTLGRDIRYVYYPGNIGTTPKLHQVIDYTNRPITFAYDAVGNLLSATGPAVTTAWNAFPAGKKESYGYDGDHNLVTITRPNQNVNPGEQGATDGTALGRPVTVVTYDASDRVETEFWGSGTVTYSYDATATAAKPAVAGLHDQVKSVTTVTDRRGNVTEYWINEHDTWTAKRERDGAVVHATYREHDRNQQIATETLPRGNKTVRVFDDGRVRTGDGGVFVDPRLQSNAIVTLVLPATGTDAIGGYPIQNDQEALIMAAAWDNVFGRPAIGWEPRAFARGPQELGALLPHPDSTVTQSDRFVRRVFFDYEEGDRAQQVGRLATLLDLTPERVDALLSHNARTVLPRIVREIQRLTGRAVTVAAPSLPPGVAGDFNEDGVDARVAGDVVLVRHPDVILVDEQTQHAGVGGSRVQVAYSTQTFNQFGQPTSVTDAEGNTTRFKYRAATNPSGQPGAGAEVKRTVPAPSPTTGGYLEQLIVDTVLWTNSPSARRRSTAPPPTNLTATYQCNLRGAHLAVTDGRGHTMRSELNELDQVVRTFAPAPYTFELERLVYDANDNVVTTLIEDHRALTGPTGAARLDAAHNVAMEAKARGFFVHRDVFNILDQHVREIADAADQGRDPAQVNGANDLLTVYERDANQNVQRIVRPRGNQLAFVFDARDLMTSQTSGLGLPTTSTTPSTVQFRYDASGARRATIDAAGGDTTRVEYDGFGRLRRVIDALGNERVYLRDVLGNTVRETTLGPIDQSAGGGSVELAVIEFRIDERGRPVEAHRRLFSAAGPPPAPLEEGDLTPGDGRISMRVTFDRANRLVASVDDERDHVGLTFHDGAGRVVKEVDAKQNVNLYTYDAASNLVQKTEIDVDDENALQAQRFVTDVSHDALDRPTRVIDNLGNETQTGYDSRGSPTHFVDAMGNVSRTMRDGLDRIRTVTRDLRLSGRGLGSTLDLTNGTNADGQITNELRWDANSNLQVLIDDQGNLTTYTFDAHDRVRRVTQPNGALTFLEYDPDHNLRTTTDPNGSIRTTTYDALNRVLGVSIQRAASVRADDAPGADPAGAQHSRQTSVAGTATQAFAYDGASRLIRASDWNDPTRSDDDSVVAIAYDSLSRVLAETQTIGGVSRRVSYGWQTTGHQASVVYPNGRTVKRTFDEVHRFTTVADEGGTGGTLARFRYLGSRAAEVGYGNGTRLTHLDDQGTRARGFDLLKRETERRVLRGDDSLVVGFRQGFDAVGNRVFEDKLHDADRGERWALDSAYRLTSFERGDLGNYVLGRQVVSELADETPAVTGQVAARTWQLDGQGNWRGGTERTHDSLGFTVDASFTRSVSPTHEYLGETRTETVTGGPPIASGPTTSRAFLHDPNGNLVDDGRLVYRWDGLDRLSRVETPAGQVLARYTYDAANRRVKKEVTAAVADPALAGITLFFHDASQIVEELFSTDPSDPARPFMTARQFTYEAGIDQPLTIDRYQAGPGSAPLDTANLTQISMGGAVSTLVHRLYYATNSLGSVVALTDTSAAVTGDAGAHLVEALEYDPYGAHTVFTRAGGAGALNVAFDGTDPAKSYEQADRSVRSSFDNPFLYTGRYFDAETGLHQYRNRYYDAALGRFLSADPSGYGDGLNLYEYVGGNPLNNRDPYGYAAQALAGAAVGALAGGVSSAVTTIMSGGSLTDALVEGSIGAVSGAITGGLACAGMPPNIASAIGSGVGDALRVMVKHLKKAIECGADIDWGAMLGEMAQAALMGAIKDLITGGLLNAGGGLAKRIGDKFGLGAAIGRMGPCAQGLVGAAAGGAVGAATSGLTGENCFLAGTLVKTEEGMKPIEDVQVSDRVWSRDPWSGEQGYRDVVRLFRNTTDVVVKVTFRPLGRGERHDVGEAGGQDGEAGEDAEPPLPEDEQTVSCTPGHAWMRPGGGQIRASQLRPGQILRDDSAEGLLEVVGVEGEEREATTFNFEVEGWHTYFVAARADAPAVWVHNNSEWTPPKHWNGPVNHGRWEGAPGNSGWIDDRPEVREIVGTNAATGEANPIPFKEGQVDFGKWKQGEVTVPELTGKHETDMPMIRRAVAQQQKLPLHRGEASAAAGHRWLQERGLRPHHAGGNVVQYIPAKLHKVQHTDVSPRPGC